MEAALIIGILQLVIPVSFPAFLLFLKAGPIPPVLSVPFFLTQLAVCAWLLALLVRLLRRLPRAKAPERESPQPPNTPARERIVEGAEPPAGEDDGEERERSEELGARASS